MPSDEYGFLKFSGTCTACGAGSHNGNKHSDNCLTHVPIALMPHWRDGYNMKPDLSEPRDRKAHNAYLMGLECREEVITRKLNSERTMRPLDEAVEIAKGIVGFTRPAV